MKRSNRNASGNILVLMSLSASSFILVALLSMSYASLIFVNNYLQSTADSVALFGAAKLNIGDRAGQMNTLVKRCRQLAFDSREKCTMTANRYPQLSNLANELMDEAQFAASDVESQRIHLREVMINESTQAMKEAFQERAGQLECNLPFMTLSQPELNCKFGEIKDVSSNVTETEFMQKLAESDRGSGLLTPLSAHFKGGRAALPGADGQMPFDFSPLPASVNGHNALAHLTSIDVFREFAFDESELPSACSVKLTAAVSGNRLPGTKETEMTVAASAITAGELPLTE